MNIGLCGYNINLVVIVILLLFGFFLYSNSNTRLHEGLSSMDAWNFGAGDIFNNAQKPNSENIYASLANNKAGKVPLPHGELNLFYDNKFDPKCCDKSQQYSSSNGCACMSVDQMKYLNARGGNNN